MCTVCVCSQEGKNIYLYVTVNNGHLTSKTQVWAKVEGPGGGKKPIGGGSHPPTGFFPAHYRPPPPQSIPVNGIGANFPAAPFPFPNKPPATAKAPARTVATNKVPTAQHPPTTTPAAAVHSSSSSSSRTESNGVVPTTAATAVTEEAVTVSRPAGTAATAVAEFEAVDDDRPAAGSGNQTKTADVNSTVTTTQQNSQHNVILTLVPVVIGTVFLIAAGVLTCLFRKRLFSNKVKSKKVNSIVSIWRNIKKNIFEIPTCNIVPVNVSRCLVRSSFIILYVFHANVVVALETLQIVSPI